MWGLLGALGWKRWGLVPDWKGPLWAGERMGWGERESRAALGRYCWCPLARNSTGRQQWQQRSVDLYVSPGWRGAEEVWVELKGGS